MEIQEDDEVAEYNEEVEAVELEAQLSIHDLTGSAHFQTTRLVGQVVKK